MTGSADGVIRIWDTRVDVSRPYVVLRGHTDRVKAHDRPRLRFIPAHC